MNRSPANTSQESDNTIVWSPAIERLIQKHQRSGAGRARAIASALAEHVKPARDPIIAPATQNRSP